MKFLRFEVVNLKKEKGLTIAHVGNTIFPNITSVKQIYHYSIFIDLEKLFLMIPHRFLFLNISFAWIFYLLAIVAVGFFAVGFYRHVAVWKKGSKHQSVQFSWRGLFNIFWDGFVTRRIWKDVSAGIMHTMILWGFLGLFAGTVLSALDHYIHHFLKGSIYLVYSLLLEIAGLMVAAGLLWAFTRRYIQKVQRLENRFEDLAVLSWLLIITLSGFILEGFRLAGQRVAWADWSFVGYWVSRFWQNPQTAMTIYPLLWWTHAILSLSLIAAIPFLKIFHMVAAPINLYFKDQPIDVVSTEARDFEKELFSFRDMISFDACTRCGRCVEVCPSSEAGELFSPRDVIGHIKSSLIDKYDSMKCFPKQRAYKMRGLEQNNQFDKETIWHCTTCGACLDACPVYVSPLEVIRSTRCGVLEDGSQISPILLQTLEKLDRYHNPWETSKEKRAIWANGLDVPVLSASNEKDNICYFIGCTTSFDNRAQDLARSFVRIMNYARIPFSILGEKEPCCGDIARRLGEDGLFEEQMDSCLELFDQSNIQNIVTSSPHCFHTFQQEYVRYQTLKNPGKKYQLNVQHYSQVLNGLIEADKIKFKKPLNYKITYHDPCYLGRHNKIFDEPRNVIAAISGVELVEMGHHRANSFCCGAGGGRMWQPDLKADIKISEIRIREAEATGAQIVVTACPLCLIMLDDARKTAGLENSLRVMDLNELVLEALDPE